MTGLKEEPVMDVARIADGTRTAAGRMLPWLLGGALVASELSRTGSVAHLAVCVLYGLLFWRNVLRNNWALVVIGLFAALTIKDGALFALGTGSFLAFAKAGSRVVSLFGAAAMIACLPRERLERRMLVPLGMIALVFGGSVFLMRKGALPYTLNANTFGMLVAWFPLALAALLKKKGDSYAWLGFLVLFVGFAFIEYDARIVGMPGSRTAPLAYALGALYILLPGSLRKPFALASVSGALIALVVLAFVFVPKIDQLLAGRQQLWQAYAHKGFERPLTGWGYTDEAANKLLLDAELAGKPIYGQFAATGLGPHNGFLSMFFENGLLAFLAYSALFVLAAWRTESAPGPFDASLLAYIGFMSADAMTPGGVSFLGFYLGFCLLAAGSRRELHDGRV